MSLTGKYVDVAYIIERVYRDYGFDLEIKYDEVIEWIWDVMSLIGAPQPMIDKITDGRDTMPNPIEIENSRGELPNDLHSVFLAREFDSKMPMICKQSSFLNDMNQTFVGTSQLTYTLNNNYIFTSFEEGQVELHYKAFPTNSLGMPMVPDDIKFIMAVQAFLAERIGFRLYMQDHMTRDKYYKLEEDRNWYMGAAKTKAQIPSIDEMEGIKNRFLRLKIHTDFHDASFVYSTDSERLILHNNLGR